MTTVKLKPDELAAFKEAFDMFDKKGDGSISTKVGAYQQKWEHINKGGPGFNGKEGRESQDKFCCKSRNLISFFTGAAWCNEASRSKSDGGRGEIVFETQSI